PGCVYMPPAETHVEIASDWGLRLVRQEKGELCPSVDRLFCSLAGALTATKQNAGQPVPQVVGAVLTGMGRDGADGVSALARAGAVTVAQDGASSVVDGMPRAAREAGAAHTVGLTEMAPRLIEWLAGTGRRR
ncbi:MAG: chemotaxis protein CheB, partial [Myxococcota bacterium]